MDSELERAWKDFGKQTQAGKLLYELYGVRYRPEQHVSYPKKLKMKEKTTTTTTTTEIEKPSTKREINIEYPVMQPKPRPKINKIDIIPKRKHADDIKNDLKQIKNEIKNLRLDKIGSNRKNEIMKLQDKFQYKENTTVPKGVRLPGLKEKDIEEVENTVVPNKAKRIYDRREELDELYNLTMRDIDERYIYMEEMKGLGKDVDMKIMAEIRDKLDDLRNLQNMINNYDRNNFK
jgi:hypothetical protein